MPTSLPTTPGIYSITNIINQKIYIGSTDNLRTRKQQHFNGLRNGTHRNRHLQRAYYVYGENAFFYQILEIVPNIDDLLVREQHYLDILSPEYNILRIAGSNRGFKHSEKTKTRLSAAHKVNPKVLANIKRLHIARKGIPLGPCANMKIAQRKRWENNPEGRAQVSKVHKNKVISAEQRIQISKKLEGRDTLNPDARARSAKNNKGKHHISSEQRIKMQEAKNAKPLTAESRKRYGDAHRDKPKSPEQRAKMSKSAKNKVKSPEHCANISKGKKGGIPWNKGKTMSPEIIAKMSEVRLGKPAWNKGIPMSEEQKAKMRATLAAKKAARQEDAS